MYLTMKSHVIFNSLFSLFYLCLVASVNIWIRGILREGGAVNKKIFSPRGAVHALHVHVCVLIK